MNAKDLRVGNIVKYADSVYLHGGKITEIGDIIQGNADYYEPIPITEEWLLKFGFEKDEDFDEAGLIDYRYEFNLLNKGLSFTSNWNTEDNIYVNYTQGGIDVFYIHQLQNLYFALTNEELTIKN